MWVQLRSPECSGTLSRPYPAPQQCLAPTGPRSERERGSESATACPGSPEHGPCLVESLEIKDRRRADVNQHPLPSVRASFVL